MRQLLEEQEYFDFTEETSLKEVKKYRARYARISAFLDANPSILELVHEDLKSLSISEKGRRAKYTTENLFRALLVHQFEKTSPRETVVRLAESSTLQAFLRLGNRPVMDFTFLDRAFKAIKPQTWKRVNEALARYAVKDFGVDVSRIRTDTTVIETNIHYPTDSSLLWDSYRVLSRLLRAVRAEAPELCPQRFHDAKAKKDFVYIQRYGRSGSVARRRERKRRFRRLLRSVRRLHGIAERLCAILQDSGREELIGHGTKLAHYLPLIRTVCETAERAELKGERVAARDRIFSLFEEHTELICRGKSRKPVEFGHAVWLAQGGGKFITDYEVMETKRADCECTEEILHRHKAAFGDYPDGIAADTGFRAEAEEMAMVEELVKTVAIPGRGLSRAKITAWWHRFRAGIEGSISVLKRAFRLAICLYRGFKSFAAAVGMAVFCHNLLNLAQRRAPS